MRIPIPKFFSSAPVVEAEDRFLACHIEESFVTMAVWGVEDGELKIFQQANPKEWQDTASLKDAVEIGISELKDAAAQVHKVLFGLPERWVGGQDIAKEYKEILKSVTHALSLHPLGFVVAREALFQHLSKLPQSSPQFLVFEFTTAELTLVLIHDGARVQQEVIGRSDQLIDDLTEGLARLHHKPYPTQLYFLSMILPKERLEEEKHTFLSHDWQQDKLFLHVPEVEVISQTMVMEAICLTGGLEVARALGVIGQKNEEMIAPAAIAIEEETTDVPAMPKKSLFAFSPFRKRMSPLPDENVIDGEEIVNITPVVMEDDDESSSQSLNRMAFFKKRAPLLLGGVLVVLLLGYFSLRSATAVQVDVTISPEAISKDVQITLDPNASQTNPEDNVLKGTTRTLEVSDQQELSTTGTKTIGEKATGTVTMLNKTESDKKFTAGTEITADGKKFTLDEDVTVASASSTETSDGKTLEFGKKDVKITAADIGAEYNLNKDTEFTIANFSKDTYAARATENLSGGSSRETQAVAKEDQQKLTDSLKKDLLKKAEEEMKANVAEGEFIVLTGKSKVISQDFSAKIDDEVDKVSSSMTLEVGAVVYKSEDLAPIAKHNLQDQVPAGSKLLEDKIAILSKQSQSASNSAQLKLDAQISAAYAPEENISDWKTRIAGKTPEQAGNVLREISGISAVDVQFQPSFSRILVGSIPRNTEKITITTRIE